MIDQETPTFQELHPYGLEPEQIQIALWILLVLIVFCIVAYIFTAIQQISSSGINAKSIMGIKPKNKHKEKREREVRLQTRNIVERQKRGNNV